MLVAVGARVRRIVTINRRALSSRHHIAVHYLLLLLASRTLLPLDILVYALNV